MANSDWLTRFTEILDGELTDAERNEFAKACQEDPEVGRAWSDFRKMVAIEQKIGAQEFRAPAHLQVKVMDQIEQEKEGLFRRLFMKGIGLNRAIIGSLATVALVVVTVRVTQERAGEAKMEVLQGASSPSVTYPITTYNDARIELEPRVSAGAPMEATRQQEMRVDAQKVQEYVGKNELFQKVAPEAKRAGQMADLAQISKPAGPAGVVGESVGALSSYTCIGCDLPLPVQAAGGEQYRHYGENQRLNPREVPLSTFSIDVDTGSYTNVRRMILRQGMLPPPDAVRIEEFLNYFPYSYPKQYEKPFAVHSEMALSPLDSGRYLLKLGVKARDSKQAEKPWNLVFLVDISGSMGDQDKLPLARTALKYLVSQMRPSDTISIVTYAGSAGVVLPPTSLERRPEIEAAIGRLEAGGGTNGSGGIAMAYQIAEQSKIPGGVNRVVLITDGDFNVGVTSHDALIQMIEAKRENGVTLTTIGVGSGNINDGMMEQLANKGNGNYFYLDSFKEAQKIFGSELFGTMEVVAKDVKIQVEFNPATVAQYRLIGYENRKLRDEDFADDRIDAGEIGAGHTVTALYELVLVGTPLAESVGAALRYQNAQTPSSTPESGGIRREEIGFVKMRFKTPEGISSELTEFPLIREALLGAGAQGSEDLRFAAAVAYFGSILRNSEFKGNYTLSQVAELAQGATGSDTEGARREFVQIVRSAAALGRDGR